MDKAPKMPKGGWSYDAGLKAFEEAGLTFGWQKNLDGRAAISKQQALVASLQPAQLSFGFMSPPDLPELTAAQTQLTSMQNSFAYGNAKDMKGWKGFFARRMVDAGNTVNRHLERQGRGFVQGGFTTVGQVMAAAPLKRIGMGYGFGLPLMGLMEFGVQGKPVTIGNVAGMAFDNIAFTIGSELAGASWKGIAKYTGWQMLGEEMGLGTWGSLGLQTVGMKLPGLGWGLTAAIAGYKAGKGLFQLGHSMYELGQKARRTSFDTGDMSWSTGEAATMRQRSLGAIQNSHLNLRSILGNEAQLLSMTR